MPKVPDSYLADKREYILQCTGEILREKPLYLVTMRDVIRKAGFSQGLIYRYYGSIGEILLDYVNRHTAPYPLGQRIDALLASGQPEDDVLIECFAAMGEYTADLLRSVGGRTCFELIVAYAWDDRASVLDRLLFRRELASARRKVVDFALNGIERGVFLPRVPAGDILLFAGSFIDGIALSAAANPALAGAALPDMFRTMALAVVGLLHA